jgi:arylsulfatase A-like enzyme
MHPADVFASTEKMHLSYVDRGNGTSPPQVVPVSYDAAQVGTVRRVYYAMGNEVDTWVGLLLDALEARRDGAEWFVVYLSDHGENQMEHLQTGKNNMYEGSARVPFIVSGPGVRRGVVSTEMVSLLDVYPTLCDIAGVEPPSFLSGHSVAPLLFGSGGGEGGREMKRERVQEREGDGEGGENGGRRGAGTAAVMAASATVPRPDYVVSQYHSTYSTRGTFMVRRGSYKLIRFGGNESVFPPMLFDVEADPFELHDVSRTRPKVVAELTAVLDAEFDWKGADAEARAFQVKKLSPFVDHGVCLLPVVCVCVCVR